MHNLYNIKHNDDDNNVNRLTFRKTQIKYDPYTLYFHVFDVVFLTSAVSVCAAPAQHGAAADGVRTTGTDSDGRTLSTGNGLWLSDRE